MTQTPAAVLDNFRRLLRGISVEQSDDCNVGRRHSGREGVISREKGVAAGRRRLLPNGSF